MPLATGEPLRDRRCCRWLSRRLPGPRTLRWSYAIAVRAPSSPGRSAGRYWKIPWRTRNNRSQGAARRCLMGQRLRRFVPRECRPVATRWPRTPPARTVSGRRVRPGYCHQWYAYPEALRCGPIPLPPGSRTWPARARRSLRSKRNARRAKAVPCLMTIALRNGRTRCNTCRTRQRCPVAARPGSRS